MIELEIQDDALSRGLAQLGAAYDDLSAPMAEIGEQLVASTLQRFSQGVSPDGVPWAARSQTTLDLYEQRNQRPRGGPLVLTGQMSRNTLSYAPDRTGVSWGSSAIQAAVMQFGADQGAFGETSRGAPIPFGDIPARPFIGISDQDRQAIDEIIADYLRMAATS